jgi:hypothetical protein
MGEVDGYSAILPRDVTGASVASRLEALGDERRRAVIETLGERGEPTDLPELAELVAARERDAPLDAVGDEETYHVHVSLYHNHVPKLVEAGFVEYDDERDIVSGTELLSPAHEFLRRFDW